jgi:hypothetical protein
MMRRRHQIVHRADKSPRTGSGKQHAESLSPVDVRIWLRAVANVFRGLWGNVLFRQRQLRQIPTSSDADAKLTTIRTIQARSKQRAGTPPLS